jgi:hypothetical protein
MGAVGRQIVLDYRAALTKNREIFLLNHGYAFHAFGGLNDCFQGLGARVQTGRDKNGKTYPDFITFLLLIQRQALSAFEALASHQSYEAWVLLRPCLESLLIMGKWVDDKKNAAIWKNRAADRNAYKVAYTGKALRSIALPRSAEIQGVLSRINDDFMHLNPVYFSRHRELRPAGEDGYHLILQYFDDEVDHKAHTFAFLHLLGVAAVSASGLLDGLFGADKKLDCRAEDLEEVLRADVLAFAREHSDRRQILTDLGLWSLS